uniref:D-beta-hydroxybutyrate dehydrogenase, mitochondrial-like n=1 Tax=Saccoglossus kowalevskii TaxID=10224 RepID=A0ABM0M6X3_SACKO|nr:PREDICTED: D-beta-hydroxybutyrate dehydrogenase, mitochondrial-like [Saccoglossus kowalevskii]
MQVLEKLEFMFSMVFADCLYPDGEGAKKLQAECSHRVVIVASDESVAMAKQKVEETLRNRTHGLWAVVYNASIFVCGDIEFSPIEIFKRLVEVNLYDTVRVAKACLRHIRRNKGTVCDIEPGQYSRATQVGMNRWSEFKEIAYKLQQFGTTPMIASRDSVKKDYGKDLIDSHVDN